VHLVQHGVDIALDLVDVLRRARHPHADRARDRQPGMSWSSGGRGWRPCRRPGWERPPTYRKHRSRRGTRQSRLRRRHRGYFRGCLVDAPPDSPTDLRPPGETPTPYAVKPTTSIRVASTQQLII
jgi:hypothetical protein